MNCEGDIMVGIVNHPNWLTFARTSVNENKCPRVAIYVNIRLSSFCFSLCKDIIDHRDILLVLFFNNNDIFWLINIYSDSSHSALKYLKDTKANIQNLLIMTGDFNIQDRLWDPFFPHYSSISNNLLIIADSFNLNLSIPINQVPTRYSDNINDLNLVINLMFLRCGLSELDNHSIHPDWCLTSSHAPLTIMIPIIEENLNSRKQSIIKDSEEKELFIKNIIASIRNLDTSNVLNILYLEKTIDIFANIVDNTWVKNSNIINIMKHLKSWWDKNYSKDLEKYRNSKSLEDWKSFHNTVKNTKHLFFDLKIQKIANKSKIHRSS